MRIAYVIWGLGLGGAENFLYQLSSDLVRKEKKVLVINLLSESYFSKKLRDQHVDVIDLDLFNRPVLSPKNLWKLIRGAYQLYRELKRYDPHLIHTLLYPADLLGGCAGRLLGRPVIWGIFSGETSPDLYSRFFRLTMLGCAKLAHTLPCSIVSCSAYGRKTHIAFGYPPKKVLYIPLGFQAGMQSSLHKPPYIISRTSKHNSALRIGMLGRFSAEKQHGLLISIGEQLIQDGIDCEMFLAGGSGVTLDNPELRKRLLENPIASRVHLLGKVPSRSGFLAMLDIFCLFSRSEGFPTVVGEAMLSELPCLVTDVGDAKVLLCDPKQIAQFNSPSDHQEKLAALCKLNDQERREVGYQNKRRILTRFPVGLMTARYRTLYQKIHTAHLETTSALDKGV